MSTLGVALGTGEAEVGLPVEPDVLCSQQPPKSSSLRGVVLAHGLLCSRFDLAHMAEAFAKKGFTVVAPEFDDSVSHDSGVVPGGFVGELLVRRETEARRCAVVEQAVDWLKQRGARAVGLVGHSRGGVTVSQVPGRCCRVNIAGFQPPQVDPIETFGGVSNAGGAELLVICGTDDEICTRPPLSLDYVQETTSKLLPKAETWYPDGVGHFDVLDPRVVGQWRDLLGPLGAFAPAPPTQEFSTSCVERVVSFLDSHLVDSGDGS